MPSTVIYDAELSRSLPLAASAASAMNALAHCVDAVYLPTHQPAAGARGRRGRPRGRADALPRLLADPDDLDVRSDMLYGAYLAGAALTGGFALQHAVAHMLGGSFGVEHGAAHAVVLPYVTAHLRHGARAARSHRRRGRRRRDLAGFLWTSRGAPGCRVRLADVGVGSGRPETRRSRSRRPPRTTRTRDWPATRRPSPRTRSVAILAAAAAGERPRSRR